MRNWLRNNSTTGNWYVSVRKTKSTLSTGKYSVVAYVDDAQEILQLFRLTWCWNG